MKGSLLVIGGDGLLGASLVDHDRRLGWPVRDTRLAPPPGDPQSERLDLSAPLDAWNPPPDCRAAVLCAAVTSLEACRRDPAGTRQINVVQTLRLASRLAAAGLFVVFLSSNLVLDGTRPRSPADAEARPQTEYGRQKAEVETGLRSLGDGAAVVRLTKVVHPRWNPAHGWREALRAGRTIEPFSDLVCAPIPLDLVVRGLGEIARRQLPGLWQFSPDTDVSYADIARHLARGLGVDDGLVRPVPGRERIDLEHLPAHTTLDARRAQSELGLTFPPPLDAVHAAFLG